jgi:hypothetical protein
MRRLGAWLSVVGLAGCGPATATGAPASDGTTTDGTTTLAAPVTTTTTGVTGSDLTGSTTDPDGGFAPRVDASTDAWPCSMFAQDCPRGQKCTVAPDYDGSACVDVVPDPAGFEEPCTVTGPSDSWSDDCDLGLLCWNTDQRGQGQCAALCAGTPEAPTCPRSHVCAQSGSGVLALCIFECDPLLQDCPADQACYPSNDSFSCAPDASGRTGAHGDPCRFINSCDPGAICINAEAHSSCEGTVGCCSQICDVADPSSDADCAARDPSQTCEAWFIDGMAPSGYEDVGVCALPP